MGVSVQWDNEEKTIIRYGYHGTFTWDDVEAMNRDITAMLNSADHKVDFIADIENVRIPKGALSKYSAMAESPVFTHCNAGVVVVVGVSPFAGALLDLFPRIYSGLAEKITSASSAEKAYEVIAAHRQAREKAV